MQVAVCPATLTLTTQLGGVSVEDVSRGAGNYPSVLEILDQQPGERFVDVRVVLFMDSRFPDYPGTFLDLRGVVKAPSVTLRMRIVEELKTTCWRVGGGGAEAVRGGEHGRRGRCAL